MIRTPGRRARTPATGPQRQGPRPGAATPAANTEHDHAQVPLFGPPVAQPAMPSAEQIALKRQRLTTTFDPLNPPDDDATTAEGVRMGVVTDQDGRHWRQQTMRLGRWVTHWKDTYPFPSEPVDVDDLSKAEKYWLDIKFRRRIPQRKMPIKQAAGRGCTGRYRALRRGNRGVLSGRVEKASRGASSDPAAGKVDDGLANFDGPPDGQGDIFGQPPESFSNPLSDTATTISKDPLRKNALFNQILAHHGIKSIASTTLDSQLRGLLPDTLFTNGGAYPTLDKIPSQNLTAINNMLRAAGLVPTDSTQSKDNKSKPERKVDGQQATSQAQAKARQQSERDISKDTGLATSEYPPARSWDTLDTNLQDVQDFGQFLNADLGAQMAAGAATAAATATASGDAGIAGNAGSVTGAAAGPGTGQKNNSAQSGSSGGPSPVFINAAQAAADQSYYWADSGSNSLMPRPISDTGHRKCSEDQIRRILVQDSDDLSAGHAWVKMRQVNDNALVYVRDDRTNSYIPLDQGSTNTPRILNLRLSNGTNVAVDESLVGTAAEHSGAVILGCDPIINDLESPSKRLVQVRLAGSLQNVADNKLGAYIGGRVNPIDESGDNVPIATGRTIDLRQNDGVVITVPVSDVDNFQHGGATIAGDSNPPVNLVEQRSDRMVWIDLGPAANSQKAQVHDNDLGLFKGSTISPPRPILPDRIARLKETSRTVNSIPVSELTNWGHQGRVILDTVPAYDTLELPSSRLLHISTRPDMVDLSVPDNQLGRYPGAVIRAPPGSDSDNQKPNVPEQVSIDQNRLVVLRLPNGGPEVRIPVASASSAHYLGATIVTTIPAENKKEPPSTTTVHVSDHGAHFDVPDNQLSRYQGWVISTVPNLTKNTPEKGQTGAGKDNLTPEHKGRANDTTQKSSSSGSSSSPSKDSPQSKGSSQSQGASQSNTSSLGSASLQGKASGGLEPSTQDKASTQDGGSTKGNASAGGTSATPSKDATQATPPSTQNKASTQSKGSTQGNAPTGGKVTPQGNANALMTPPATQGKAASAGSDDWETNVDYAANINAPEFISPTKKDFPDGRPDKNGNLPRPRPRRPRRSNPDELEHLRQLRDSLNRKETFRGYLTTADRTDTGSASGGSTNVGPLVGAVTVRAGSGPSSGVGSQRSMIQGTSRTNLHPKAATPAPSAQAPVAGESKPAIATTMPPTTAAAKSSRVQKRSGKGSGTGRNVRFGPLPTEADTGRERGVGLRTRSGTLYGKQRRSGKGV